MKSDVFKIPGPPVDGRDARRPFYYNLNISIDVRIRDTRSDIVFASVYVLSSR